MNRIKIDLERKINDIDRNIFGGTMEIGYSDSKYEYLNIDDSINSNKSGLRKDILVALERLNLTNIRFPGGNFASGYRWMDGIGPRELRPTRHDLAFDCEVQNSYGTNEFVRFCRALNIEPYLTINCGDGDLREAADWVEYCNGIGQSALATLRRKHGYQESHRVKYWGIGNEVDNPHQIGYKTPQEYARAVTEFSKVMKRVDPGIKVIASGVCSWEDDPLNPEFLYRKTEWVERAQLILEQAGDRIDYLSIHRYTYPHQDDPFENYMAFAADFHQRLNAYEGIIRAVSLEKGIRQKIRIAVDEWFAMRIPDDSHVDTKTNAAKDEQFQNEVNTGENAGVLRREWQGLNLEAALATALYLNAFIRHANSVGMANFCAPMPMSLGLNGPDNNSAVLLPAIFYPFELYSRTCGQSALNVFWSGETFSGKFKDRLYSGLRALDVAATLDETHNQLVIYVVNQSKEVTMETTISLDSGEFIENVRAYVVNGPAVGAENTVDKPNQIATRELSSQVSGKSFIYNFEPHSISALICAVK